jgi:hypothetical protein
MISTTPAMIAAMSQVGTADELPASAAAVYCGITNSAITPMITTNITA